VRGTREHAVFRALFGDESKDYASSIAAHHARGARDDWQVSHVTAYAASHPWEDFAETFSHYLHMVDAIETARSYGLAISPRTEDGTALPGVAARRVHPDSIQEVVAAWIPLTIALNSFSRGLGLPDVYPFVLTERVVEKLSFVHRLVDSTARARAA
jgi:hypothetical protein